MSKSYVDPMRTREAYERLIGPIRDKARELGYAVGVHGSVARDIDLIACPWTDEAVDEVELAEALAATIAANNGGVSFMHPDEADVEWFKAGCQPHGKAHGRRCWCFHLGGGPYIDLSVMPRRPD